MLSYLFAFLHGVVHILLELTLKSIILIASWSVIIRKFWFSNCVQYYFLQYICAFYDRIFQLEQVIFFGCTLFELLQTSRSKNTSSSLNIHSYSHFSYQLHINSVDLMLSCGSLDISSKIAATFFISHFFLYCLNNSAL